MNATEFLTIAREKISDDPHTRVTPLAKAALDNPDCLIDVHAHIFDKKCLTVGYILLRMIQSKLGLESAGLLGKTEKTIYEDIEFKRLNEDSDLKNLEAELEILEGVELFGFNLKEAFKVLRKHSMLEVLDLYRNSFSILQIPEFKNNPFLTGILLMDLETGWSIKPDKKYFDQIQEVKQISKERPILPFLAVDPRRADLTDKKENLYELFLNAFVDTPTPFFGVKCYPALGYFPSDLRLDPIFQICAEKNIPVLSHCGGEVVSTFEKKITIRTSAGDLEFKLPGDSRVERARFLNDPGHWDSVLNKHPNIKLNVAHFGGDTNWGLLGTNGTNQRIEKIMDMMRNPEWKVYTDFSFNVVEEELFNTFENQMNTKPDIARKTLFGTDYWVVLPAGDLLGMQKKFLEKMKAHQKTLLQSAPRSYLFD